MQINTKFNIGDELYCIREQVSFHKEVNCDKCGNQETKERYKKVIKKAQVKDIYIDVSTNKHCRTEIRYIFHNSYIHKEDELFRTEREAQEELEKINAEAIKN